MMSGEQLAKKAKDIAQNYKTSYIWGGFGAPITESSLQRAINQYSKNKSYAAKARCFLGRDAFYFDCVGLVKALLWGWVGDPDKTYGGAIYASNGVPDINADTMIGKCTGVSTNFSAMSVGELLWTSGHVGIYIGNGLAVECTPSWDNGVQITAVQNIGTKSGYNARKWTKHGKLPYCTYEAATSTATTSSSSKKTTTDPAKSFSKDYARFYTVTASALNMRRGAGITKGIIKSLPKGSKVTCYGYYTKNGPTTWLYVQDATGATGFCSKSYLK